MQLGDRIAPGQLVSAPGSGQRNHLAHACQRDHGAFVLGGRRLCTCRRSAKASASTPMDRHHTTKDRQGGDRIASSSGRSRPWWSGNANRRLAPRASSNRIGTRPGLPGHRRRPRPTGTATPPQPISPRPARRSTPAPRSARPPHGAAPSVFHRANARCIRPPVSRLLRWGNASS